MRSKKAELLLGFLLRLLEFTRQEDPSDQEIQPPQDVSFTRSRRSNRPACPARTWDRGGACSTDTRWAH